MKIRLTLGLLTCLLSAHTAGQTFDTPQAYYEDANRLYHSGDPKAAEVQLRNALQLYADHVPSLLLLGRIELDQFAAGEAIQLLEEALMQGADPTIVLQPLAEAYLRRGEYTRLLERIPLERVPEEMLPPLLAAHAEANIALSRLDQAEANLEQGVALNGDLLELKLANATLWLRQGKIDLAERLAKELVVDHADDSRSWSVRASVHHLRGEIAEAIDGYEKAIKISAYSADARVALSSLLIDSSAFDAAEAQIAWMRENIPSDPRAAYFSALLAAHSGDQDKEIAELEIAAGIFDALGSEKMATDHQMQMISGLTYYSQGAFEKARGPVAQYRAHDREDVGAARLMAAILIAMNEADDAVQLLQPFQRRMPSDVATTIALADALNAADKPLEAARLLETVTGIGSGEHAGDLRLAKALLDSGDTARGTALLRLSMAAQGTSKPSLLLALANIRNNDFAEARNQLARIADVHGWNPLLSNLDAIALAGAGERNAALKTLKELTESHPEFYPAWINLGRLQRNDGNLLAARTSIQRAQRLAPDDPRLDFEMAQQLIAEKDPEEALRHAERAAITSPGTLAYAVLETELQLTLGNAEDALDAALRASSYEGAAPAAKRLLAIVQARTGDRDQALITLKRAARGADFNAVELNNIANLQMDLGDYQAAAASISDALKGNGSYLPARRTNVQIAIGLGKPESALAMAQELAVAHPEEPVQHLLIGEAAMAASEFTTAHSAFTQAETLGAGDMAVIGQVDALIARGREAEAVERIAAYVESGGKHPELRGRYSDELLRKQDWSSALPVLESLAADYPDTATVINNLAIAQFELGNPLAAETARRALQLAPTQAYAHDTLGWILLHTGHATEALGHLREATTRAARNPEMRFHLAAALAKLNRNPEALKELTEALRSDTQFTDRSSAIALLEQLEAAE